MILKTRTNLSQTKPPFSREDTDYTDNTDDTVDTDNTDDSVDTNFIDNTDD